MFPLYDENPSKTFPFITISLIIINIGIFINEISLGSNLHQFIQAYALIPFNISNGQGYLGFITSMFIHGGFFHIFGNMLYLWIFGNNIEDTLGHFKFFLFYILCGLGGSLAQIIVSPNSQTPIIGASGAIAGVLAAYLIMFPTARIATLVPIFLFLQVIRLPAILVIGFWIVVQFLNGIALINGQTTGVSEGVAWFAHIGGFLTGAVLILILPKKRRRNSYF
ncbi:MAG: rhomboid family intramembrane serine protease [Actinobacteria bacterium]|nr:rhomboid family intramembrane serine protease [Actinomycetota bacterium]